MLADIVARWPGSTHDSHIFRASAVGGNLEGTGLKDGALGTRGWWPYMLSIPHDHVPQPQNTSGGAF